ncbi:hypothetical protein [Streptomyces sp. NBC_01431]|nr:hypothetical protein [Streptomyces sp. NBC_01431]
MTPHARPAVHPVGDTLVGLTGMSPNQPTAVRESADVCTAAIRARG